MQNLLASGRQRVPSRPFLKERLIALALLPACLLAVGCEYQPEDIVKPVEPPAEAAVPNIITPIPNQVFLISYNQDKLFSYHHNSDKKYQSSTTTLVDPYGSDIRILKNFPAYGAGNYYESSLPSFGHDFVSNYGTYGLKASYVTAVASVPGGNYVSSKTNIFHVCGWDDQACRARGLEAPIQPLPVLTASMGPFFSSSNFGSSVSQAEIESLAEGLNSAQVNAIAPIIQQAYGKDVYEYFDPTPGGGGEDPPSDCSDPTVLCEGGMRATGSIEHDPGDLASSSSTPEVAVAEARSPSSFLAFTERLSRIDPSRLTPAKRVALNRLLRFRARYSAERAARTSPAAAPNVMAESAAQVDEVRPALALRVWPSVATSRVRLRVDGMQVTSVAVYDLQGRRVAHLASETDPSVQEWDLRGASGARVAAGVYYVVAMGADGRRATGRVTVR